MQRVFLACAAHVQQPALLTAGPSPHAHVLPRPYSVLLPLTLPLHALGLAEHAAARRYVLLLQVGPGPATAACQGAAVDRATPAATAAAGGVVGAHGAR